MDAAAAVPEALVVGCLFARRLADPPFGSELVVAALGGTLVAGHPAAVAALPGESTPRPLGAVLARLRERRLRLVARRPGFWDTRTGT